MHPSSPPPDLRGDIRNDPAGRHGDVDINGDLVDQLPERQLAELRDRIARARLAQDSSAASTLRRPPRPRPRPKAPSPPTPAPEAPPPSVAVEHPVVKGGGAVDGIETKVKPRLVRFDDLEPAPRARAQRLLGVVAASSPELAETQACLVALALERGAA